MDPSFVPERDGIVTEAEFQAQTAEKASEPLVVAATFPTSGEAEVARIILEQEGVKSFVANELSNTLNWLWSPAIGAIQVMVLEPDLLRARMVLEKMMEKKPAEGPPAAGGSVDDRIKPA